MKRDPAFLLFELDPDQRSSRGLWLLALLYFGSLVSGAALSLVAFRLTHYFDPDASSYLAGKSYSDFFDRARWVSVLALLPYLFVSCRLTSWRAIGFLRPGAKTFLAWFAWGVPMIFLIYGFNLATGAFTLNPAWSASSLFGDIAAAATAALLIGALEEVVFRGLVFRLFYSAMRPLPAILLSSLFFAILHFKTPDFSLEGVAPNEHGLSEALAIAWGTAVAPIAQFDLKYLLAIFLVGIVLHQVFVLGRNLWASIGLHAGWVFTIKLFDGAFQTTEQANAFSGTTRVADGYWVSVVLIAFVAFFAYRIKQKESRSPAHTT